MDNSKGMSSPLVRWWVAFSVMMVALASALIAGLGKFIAASDQTHLSWVILGIFVATSIHLNYKVFKRGRDADFGVTDKATELCTTLGLLGTIIGLIMAITGAFTEVDVSNHESLKEALVSISSGVGTALVTTLVGLVCAIMLIVQLAVVREKWSE